ncbi:MAG: CRISPR-associated endonuclease Cas2 [Candidatus Taylorbacteria bacterium CG11_big_fil_rev_8_21_14_0_20_46_11]|uniref:CRISPR-associated endonuclease Cas2 n=1 Tax=Candidatus Taylorbacteria bacterium CG11_big_fil_rev_8_21_14_0_20_46_11 TaxID=1975025 RepID=A0A2H0KBU0_9BACT|nr:MAG: CRISPR-associated endonuclease Cas2 [Candidatus Taylorbacteria bacterium CG11_big_fil_rev_8_21_14_0_20_46_11]
MKRGQTKGHEERKIKLRKQGRKLGSVQQKLLLLLLGGFALSCTRSTSKQWRLIKGMLEHWKEIDKGTVERAIASLYESRLIEERNNADGTTTLILSEDGKKRALTYRSRDMKIRPPTMWDKKWRVVIFDIPEDERDARNSLREHLADLGFYKLQQSVSVHPFECRDEIDFLVELHDIRKYVRFMLVEHIDNELDIKRFFHLERMHI